MKGQLYIVATPIGNLADVTFRAIETLKNADLIACEDTRVSRKLLDHYHISAEMVAYHQHSGPAKTDLIVRRLEQGEKIALVTDAGTPGIADPGNKLIAEVLEKLGDQVEIITIPGPAAIIAALSISGLPTDRFVFFGFLPHKKGKQTTIKKIIENEETVVFYESTHRIIKTLEMMKSLMPSGAPEKKLVVCRELTKKFETIYRGSVSEVLEQIKATSAKGEFVIVAGN